jgi:hypothetical protein
VDLAEDLQQALQLALGQAGRRLAVALHAGELNG